MTTTDTATSAGIRRNEPIRVKPFESTCFISGNEIELVTECLESRNWSSFKGGTEGWKLEDCISMPSAQAATYDATAIRFLGGKFVRQLEADVARETGTKFAVSANSATSALSWQWVRSTSSPATK